MEARRVVVVCISFFDDEEKTKALQFPGPSNKNVKPRIVMVFSLGPLSSFGLYGTNLTIFTNRFPILYLRAPVKETE